LFEGILLAGLVNWDWGIYMSALLWHFELAAVLDLGWMDVWSWRFFGILLSPSVIEYSRNNMSWFLVDPLLSWNLRGLVNYV